MFLWWLGLGMGLRTFRMIAGASEMFVSGWGLSWAGLGSSEAVLGLLVGWQAMIAGQASWLVGLAWVSGRRALAFER